MTTVEVLPWYAILNADSIASPGVLVYPDRINENLRRMIAMVGDVSRLRPHVKTHKMARVVEMKLAAGITKFKTSTIAEVEMTLAAGGRDVLLAYQPVGPNIDRLIELTRRYPDAVIAGLVDDADVLQKISESAMAAGVRVPLYVDLNVGMNRTGVVPHQAATLYSLLCRCGGVRAAGLHAYDGHLQSKNPETLKTNTDDAFEPVWKLKDQLGLLGLKVPKLIASGTPTSKWMAIHENVEVGAGTTVLWDAGQAEICPDLDFQNAAVLITRVISRPMPGHLCLDLGHKAVASEFTPPRAMFFGLEDARPVTHSEEHLVIATDHADDYPVGTVVYGVPCHVCPTMALHQHVWAVRNHVAAETWPVTARNRCLTV